MASLYKRGARYWTGYSQNGRGIDRSLVTDNLRVARHKSRKIEHEVAIGDRHQASTRSLVPLLKALCRHLQATRTYKPYRNDVSLLRVFFGPVCKSLELSHPSLRRAAEEAKFDGPLRAFTQMIARHRATAGDPMWCGTGQRPLIAIPGRFPIRPSLAQELLIDRRIGHRGTNARAVSRGSVRTWRALHLRTLDSSGSHHSIFSYLCLKTAPQGGNKSCSTCMTRLC